MDSPRSASSRGLLHDRILYTVDTSNEPGGTGRHAAPLNHAVLGEAVPHVPASDAALTNAARAIDVSAVAASVKDRASSPSQPSSPRLTITVLSWKLPDESQDMGVFLRRLYRHLEGALASVQGARLALMRDRVEHALRGEHGADEIDRASDKDLTRALMDEAARLATGFQTRNASEKASAPPTVPPIAYPIGALQFVTFDKRVALTSGTAGSGSRVDEGMASPPPSSPARRWSEQLEAIGWQRLAAPPNALLARLRAERSRGSVAPCEHVSEEPQAMWRIPVTSSPLNEALWRCHPVTLDGSAFLEAGLRSADELLWGMAPGQPYRLLAAARTSATDSKAKEHASVDAAPTGPPVSGSEAPSSAHLDPIADWTKLVRALLANASQEHGGHHGADHDVDPGAPPLASFSSPTLQNSASGQRARVALPADLHPLAFLGLCDLMGVVATLDFGLPVEWPVADTDEEGVDPKGNRMVDPSPVLHVHHVHTSLASSPTELERPHREDSAASSSNGRASKAAAGTTGSEEEAQGGRSTDDGPLPTNAGTGHGFFVPVGQQLVRLAMLHPSAEGLLHWFQQQFRPEA